MSRYSHRRRRGRGLYIARIGIAAAPAGAAVLRSKRKDWVCRGKRGCVRAGWRRCGRARSWPLRRGCCSPAERLLGYLVCTERAGRWYCWLRLDGIRLLAGMTTWVHPDALGTFRVNAVGTMSDVEVQCRCRWCDFVSRSVGRIEIVCSLIVLAGCQRTGCDDIVVFVHIDVVCLSGAGGGGGECACGR